MGAVIGYDEALAHQMQAGIDALLMPSRFEPCGLSQLCALRYGAVPVVSRVGGLADTVIDANEAAVRAGVATGICYSDLSQAGLVTAVRRTLQVFGDHGTWTRLQRNEMTAEIGWAKAAGEYRAVFVPA